MDTKIYSDKYMSSRSTSKNQKKSRSRSTSKSRSPTVSESNEPLTLSEFEKRVGDIGFAKQVNESLIGHYPHYFTKLRKDEEEEFKDMITNDDIKKIKDKFQKLNDKGKPVAINTYRKIEKAPYNWQKLVIEVTKLLKDVEMSLSIDRYTWDAGLLVIFAAYPRFLKSGVFQNYIEYKQLRPMF